MNSFRQTSGIDERQLVATISGVDRKGDTVPYTSVNGHMLVPAGIVYYCCPCAS